MTGVEEIALAEALFKALAEIYKMYESAKAGSTTPQDALDALSAFGKSLAANNAAVDAALDAKFPK